MSEEKAGWDNKSFKVQATTENRALLKQLEDLARKDGWSFSQLIREALLEYARRHAPGNPQLALAHWTEDLPMPETVQEKKGVTEWQRRQLEEKERGEKRWAKLQAMTNDDLLARQKRLQDRDGSYMENLEISMILIHRRLSSKHESVPPKDT